MTTSTFEARLKARASDLGFATIRIADARIPSNRSRDYRAFIDAGLHGEMDWLARDPERRATPEGLWPEARSAIVCGMSYAPATDPLAVLGQADRGAISVYARGRDYHDVVKGRLKQLAGWVAKETGEAVKVFVDTAPLLEKPLAQQAGLGWQGKHTNLVSREHGSWLFLGEILTARQLVADAADTDHCGSCRRCLDICPTDAFLEPYKLDARRCISYLTIEHKGPIPVSLRPAMGNRIYGCDDCLAVCPWNKFAKAATEAKLQAREELGAPSLAELAALDDTSFRRLFTASPIKRIGRDRLLRNVAIAIGNSGDRGLVPAIERLLEDAAPLVRAAAVWAIRRLLSANEAGLRLRRLFETEEHPWVIDELGARPTTAVMPEPACSPPPA